MPPAGFEVDLALWSFFFCSSDVPESGELELHPVCNTTGDRSRQGSRNRTTVFRTRVITWARLKERLERPILSPIDRTGLEQLLEMVAGGGFGVQRFEPQYRGSVPLPETGRVVIQRWALNCCQFSYEARINSVGKLVAWRCLRQFQRRRLLFGGRFRCGIGSRDKCHSQLMQGAIEHFLFFVGQVALCFLLKH